MHLGAYKYATICQDKYFSKKWFPLLCKYSASGLCGKKDVAKVGKNKNL